MGLVEHKSKYVHWKPASFTIPIGICGERKSNIDVADVSFLLENMPFNIFIVAFTCVSMI